jgi:predicted RNase H-like nuclease (RuvC/YqgF family)
MIDQAREIANSLAADRMIDRAKEENQQLHYQIFNLKHENAELRRRLAIWCPTFEVNDSV